MTTILAEVRVTLLSLCSQGVGRPVAPTAGVCGTQWPGHLCHALPLWPTRHLL